MTRLEWAKEVKALIDTGYDFEDVVFTDESKVQLEHHKLTSWRYIISYTILLDLSVNFL